jgi:hypothetical protein
VSNGSLTIGRILSILSETPPRIAALTDGLPPAQLHAPPEPGEWSARDVLAHLRSCGDVWGDYIMTILAEDRPAIKAISPRTWIKETDYLEQEFQPLVQAFAARRADLLSVLEPLPAGGWSRVARVSAVGRVCERSVLDYAERMARHERSHVRQIERIVSKMHS